MLSGKTVLLGITGAIAAYKIPELIRRLQKQNANVICIVTENALKFTTLETLQTISKNKVYKDLFSEDWEVDHVCLSNKADIMLIAPCSANTAAKISSGICDNLLTSIVCAFGKKIVIAPCMNDGMWNNYVTKENFTKLKTLGMTIIEPEEGYLACGTKGKGRLANLDEIVSKVIEETSDKKLNIDLSGKKVIVTAGGTKERIDPVRFIGNDSSGKTGIAFADFAHLHGAKTVLITTADVDKPYKTILVETAQEMEKVVFEEFEDADYLIMSAAVADFKVKNISEQKIKKCDGLTLELEKNPDILKEICKLERKNRKIIGFCAESENLKENARKKLTEKNCDFIVANDISRKDTGFNSDNNEVIVFCKDGREIFVPKTSKKEIAEKVGEIIYA